LIPFYSIKDAVKVVDDAVAQLREERFESLHQMAHRGPDARYVLKKREGDDEPAVFEWKWLCEPVQGIACHLDSLGFKSLAQATQEIIGEVKPLADTGTPHPPSDPPLLLTHNSRHAPSCGGPPGRRL
jgi:acetylornithine deacetylase